MVFITHGGKYFSSPEKTPAGFSILPYHIPILPWLSGEAEISHLIQMPPTGQPQCHCRNQP